MHTLQYLAHSMPFHFEHRH